DLNLGGTLGLRGNAGLNFSLNGALDLTKLDTLSTNVFVTGVISVDARLNGTFDNPQLGGEIRMRDLSFSTLDSPIALEQGSGVIVFTGDKAVLQSFTARANDGNVQASGTVTLAKLQPTQWRINLMASNVQLLYQGAVASFNSNLLLTGDSSDQVL